MNNIDRIGVCSRSFSRNIVLRAELLKRYSNVKFNDDGLALQGDELVRFLSGCTKAITALEEINDGVLQKLPELKVIGKYGVGKDMIDMDAMRRHGKKLGWTAGVNKRSVSEMVISLMVSMLRKLPKAKDDLILGQWKQIVGGLLSERTVGIIGCGHIGKDLIELLQPWGCKVLAHDIVDFKNFYQKYNVESVNLKDLLMRSDIVTLHVPLDESTRNMLDPEHLGFMKSSAILINAARGGLVDEVALKNMLIEHRLAGAAFDVFAVEPPKDQELLRLENFFATPHLGGSSEEAIFAMGMAAISGLDDNKSPDFGANSNAV